MVSQRKLDTPVKKMTQEELKSLISELPKVRDSSYRWDKHRQNIRNHILTEDINFFIDWSTIQATMYAGENIERTKEYDFLFDNSDLGHRLLIATVNPIGSPTYKKDTRNWNYLHQAYKLLQLYKLLNIDIAKSNIESIAEFGGGYGAMRTIIHNLKFQGRYFMYDFPELLLLQEYYLSNFGISSYYESDYKSQNLVDLVISILSLSEAPIETREKFLNHTIGKYYFIQFQENFFGIDNYAWFEDWAQENLDEWGIERAKMQTHYYLFGTRTI